MNGRTAVMIASILAAAAGAHAQTAPAAEDSLCLHFTSDIREIHLELTGAYSMNGTLPLTLCNLRSGERYRLVVRGRGLELRRGYLSIGKDGTPSASGNRIGTFLRNAVVPGWGSIHAGRNKDGWTDLISLAAVGGVFYREQREWEHLDNRHTVLLELLETEDDADRVDDIRLQAYITSRDVNVQNRHRQRLAIFAAYLYGFQLIDPWLVGNPPRVRAEAGGTIVNVGTGGQSTAKALCLSLIRPGRGQFYQGKETRGVVYSLLMTTAGLVALDYHNKYDKAVNEYEINLERMSLAGTASQRQTLIGREPGLWDNVEDRKLQRNIAYGVLAGVWAASVIDTFFPGREEAPPSDLTLDIGPTHAFVVYRF